MTAPESPDAAPDARSVRSPATSADATSSHSYGQILKSSALIGGSSAFNVVTAILRAKAMAVLLGPSGFGLMGLYGSIVNLAQTVAGMGINSSGVRQIAAAAGSDDPMLVARTAIVLRRASVALGMVGAVGLVLLSGPVSRLTFDSYEHANPVALLSLAVLFRIVSDAQGALLQGLRRIPDLARVAILGGIFGTVVSVLLVYFLGEQGVAPSLIAIAAASLIFSWWFSRRVRFETPPLSASRMSREAAALLKLGFAFMASGVLTMGAAYLVRMMIVRQIGFEAAGLYQAAWTIGGLYVGFILQAMGADFYPRLTAAVTDHSKCNRLVNEQAEVSLLMAGPGIVATLTFAPIVLALLYSGAFHPAVEILRWICLGATLKVITWPMGFIIVAAGRQGIFFWCELAYTVAYLGMAWVFVRSVGVSGAGIAFFASYVFHGLLIYPIVGRLTGFRWSPTNRRLGIGFLVTISLVFGGFFVLPFWLATTLGALTAVLSGVYSARLLVRMLPVDRLPPLAQRLLRLARIRPRP